MILIFSQAFAQEKNKSEAFKKNPFRQHSVFKPKYNSYPLVAGYLLLKDAKSGDPFAEHELGLRYLLGKGFPKDTAKAIYWIKKAADQNLTTANFNYGIMLLNGIGTEWNPFEAFKRFRYAAKAGMPEAEYIYATFFIDNLVVSRNYQKAYYWLTKAAKQKVKQAEKLLARMRKSGIVFSPPAESQSGKDTTTSAKQFSYSYNPKTELLNSNYELSFYNFESDSASKKKGRELQKLLSENSSELINKLGLELFDSTKVKNNPFEIITEAASYGSPNAYKLLGKFYEHGVNVRKDTVLSVLNYLRALRLGAAETSTEILRLIQTQNFFHKLETLAKQKNPNAEYVLAALTALNFSFQITKEQAFALLQQAAQKGNVPSLIELGLAYFNGSTVKKDPTQAQEYWDKAAKLGSGEAKVRIAFASVLYAPKRKDLKNEIAFLKESAKKGSVPALNALAYLYQNGIGVKKCKAKAAEYYRKAFYLGDQKSFDALRAMYDEIRPSDKLFQIYDLE